MKTLEVKGMSCQHCVASVTEALVAVPGLKDIKVDLDSGSASFESDGQADADQIKKAVEAVGFETGAIKE